MASRIHRWCSVNKARLTTHRVMCSYKQAALPKPTVVALMGAVGGGQQYAASHTGTLSTSYVAGAVDVNMAVNDARL